MAYVHLVLLALALACFILASLEIDVPIPGMPNTSKRLHFGWIGLAIYVIGDAVVEISGLLP